MSAFSCETPKFHKLCGTIRRTKNSPALENTGLVDIAELGQRGKVRRAQPPPRWGQGGGHDKFITAM
jgi:hypothetical protein